MKLLIQLLKTDFQSQKYSCNLPSGISAAYFGSAPYDSRSTLELVVKVVGNDDDVLDVLVFGSGLGKSRGEGNNGKTSVLSRATGWGQGGRRFQLVCTWDGCKNERQEESGQPQQLS